MTNRNKTPSKPAPLDVTEDRPTGDEVPTQTVQSENPNNDDLPAAKMRAKLRISGVFPTQAGDMEVLRFHGVAKSDGPYPEDGSDENNTYAKFSPSVDLQLLLANPALVGSFAVGDTFYVDFIPALK